MKFGKERWFSISLSKKSWMVSNKGDKEESGFEDNGSATNNSDDEEDQLDQGYFYEEGCSFYLRNTS